MSLRCLIQGAPASMSCEAQKIGVLAGAVRIKPIALTAISAMVGAYFILNDPIFNGLNRLNGLNRPNGINRLNGPTDKRRTL